jgi:hypothetical protein
MRRLFLAFALTLTLVVMFGNNAFAQNLTPQGRLTLQSMTPVMTTDVMNAPAVYYTPYVGNSIPISNGTSMVSNTFSQLTMTLNSTNQTSGTIYDLFVFLNSGTVTIGAGPAWYSDTQRCVCTAMIQQTGGIWVNYSIITLTNGSTTYSSIPAGEATYVGSVYIPTAGETTVQFKPNAESGGTANLIGLFNAYNRVPLHSLDRDSNGSWTNSNTSSWSVADTTSNQITWLDGLQQVQVKASYIDLGATNTNATAIYVGLLLDHTSGTPDLWSVQTFGTASNWNTTLNVEETFPPQIGLHYVQAMDWVGGSSLTATFYGNEFAALTLDGEY